MNKNDLIEYVSDKLFITKKDSSVIVDVFLDGIKKGILNGDRVSIKNFGSFYVNKNKCRKIKTTWNESGYIEVPEKRYIRFKSSKKFQSLLND